MKKAKEINAKLLAVKKWSNCSLRVYEDGAKVLLSYDTVVAYMDGKGSLHRLWGGWSQTTMGHVRKAFEIAHMVKAEWLAMPVERVYVWDWYRF